MNDHIKAVIFDVGGVLIRTVDQSGRRYWEDRLNLPPGGAEAIVLNSPMGYRAQRGEITTEELWDWVGNYLGLGEHLADFRHDFWRGDALDHELLALIREIRPKYKLAIISNASDILLETLKEYGLATEFDLIIGSAYEGIMKPDNAIFERALQRLDCQPLESVFIDDSFANVDAARSIGMKAIHYSVGLDLRTELRAIGVGYPVARVF